MITWLIGLSGAGKSTLAQALYARFKPSVSHLVLLDGDEIRSVFGNDVDHSVAGRRRNAERLSKLCQMLDAQRIHVIAAVLSIFPEWQEWNRKTFSGYCEIFLDMPLSALERRDVKGLYAQARRGEISSVVGIDIPFPPPPRPDLVLSESDLAQSVEACVDIILRRTALKAALAT